MKKILSLLLTAFLLAQLTACGQSTVPGDQEDPDVSTSSAEERDSLGKGKGLSAFNFTPKTASSPAAYKIDDVPHASGVTENITDPDTGKTYTVVEDLGAFGNSRTMNCFDEAGDLVWWENFEYDEDKKNTAINRLNPAGDELLSREILSYEGDVLAKMEHYDIVDTGNGSKDKCKRFVETYYPDKTVSSRTVYFPYEDLSAYVPEHTYEYDESGKETYHSVCDTDGTVLEEYVNGELVVEVPDTVFEIFELLNDTDDDKFDIVWKACREKMDESGMNDEWDGLCVTYSGLLDEYNGTLLYRMREEYGLKLFDNKGRLRHDNTVNRSDLVYYTQDDTVNPKLHELMYRPGSFLDFGGTIWLPDEYKEAKENVEELPERIEDGLIRILVVDASKTIWNDKINSDLLLNDSSSVNRIIERAETLVGGIFGDYSDKVVLTSYPELADVVIEIKAEYPLAGTYYYSDGTPAKVWNFKGTVKATNQRGKGEFSDTFRHTAGNTVSVSGGTEIFMMVPDLTEDAYKDRVTKFANTVISWYSEEE